jgi:small subunit ribosomal protein S16
MRDGGFIERIGHYDPMLPKDREDRVVIDLERAKHWLSVGAQPTDRISKFLEKEGVLEPKTRNNPQKAKPGTKAQERIEAARLKAEEAAQAKADAEAAPAEAEAPAEEAPAEETQAEEVPAEEKAAES